MTPSNTRIRLRWDEFARLADCRGWETNQERAKQLGISPGHLTNVRKQRDGVGAKFIRGCVRVWGAPIYDVLFEEVDADATDVVEAKVA